MMFASRRVNIPDLLQHQIRNGKFSRAIGRFHGTTTCLLGCSWDSGIDVGWRLRWDCPKAVP